MKILKYTVSYHEELIEFLKNPTAADLYLQIAVQEYQEDGDTELLLVALRNIIKARKGKTISN